MKATRKQKATFNVEKFKEMINTYFARKDTTATGRDAVAEILETVLFETGNYRGFQYLETDEKEGAGSRVRYF